MQNPMDPSPVSRMVGRAKIAREVKEIQYSTSYKGAPIGELSSCLDNVKHSLDALTATGGSVSNSDSWTLSSD